MYLPLLKSCVVTILLLIAHIGFSQNGLLAEYYNGTELEHFVSSNYVDNIEDTWYDTPPVEGIDPHDCSIRWTGKLKPGKTATYLFSAKVDDGIRVWIDGQIIMDQWDLNDLGLFTGKMALIANKEYDLKVEYFNALREGEIQLLWDMEKTKDEQSWYERVFGVEYHYEVIKSDYFIRPDIPVEKVEVQEEAPAPKPIVNNKPSTLVVSIPEPSRTITTTTTTTPEKKETKVFSLKKAIAYIPKNVQFERTKAELLAESHKELDVFAKFMVDNPHVSVTIEGHTDVVGKKGSNQFLSERRANRVARYLVEKGVYGLRIKTIGYGGTKPLKVPEEGEYYPKNRRVVFKLKGLE